MDSMARSCAQHPLQPSSIALLVYHLQICCWEPGRTGHICTHLQPSTSHALFSVPGSPRILLLAAFSIFLVYVDKVFDHNPSKSQVTHVLHSLIVDKIFYRLLANDPWNAS
nr:uncharacterized protein LOC109775611 isoform X3 [Aegilops tauschii subsp. strangulata]